MGMTKTVLWVMYKKKWILSVQSSWQWMLWALWCYSCWCHCGPKQQASWAESVFLSGIKQNTALIPMMLRAWCVPLCLFQSWYCRLSRSFVKLTDQETHQNNAEQIKREVKCSAHRQLHTNNKIQQKPSGKRLPKYDPQSETAIDSYHWLGTIPGQHRNRKTRVPTLVTPRPNQIRE